MVVVTAALNSKRLHRIAGWTFFASGYDEVSEELDHADLASLSSFKLIHIYSWKSAQAHLVGIENEYPKYQWMFDDQSIGPGLTHVYVQPHANTTDIHVYLGPKREAAWELELDRVLGSSHLEIEITLDHFLGRSERATDRHNGMLLTFHAIPELAISRTGPEA